MKKIIGFFLFLLPLFASTACQAEVTLPATATTIPTSTPLAFITATLPATQVPLASPTLLPAPSATPNPPAEGETTSQLNVRKEPSADSEQVGVVEQSVTVQIIGKDPSNKWWLILLPESPTEKGWVTTQFLKVADSSTVPVMNTQGQGENQASIAESSSLTGVPSPTSQPTPVFAAAPEDGDSAQNPAINITLSAASVPYIEYSNEISSPEGDGDDWVQFVLAGGAGQEQIVSVVVNCSGSSKPNIELSQNGVVLQKWESVFCGQPQQLQLYLYVGAPYSLHLFPAQGNTALNYISYDLTVQLVK